MKRLIILFMAVLITMTAQAQKPLIEAVLDSDIQRIASLIKNGANVNEENEQGWRPIIVAFSRDIEPTDRYQIVQLLASNKADLNIGVEGRSPLWIAYRSGEYGLVKLLLNYGADMNVETPEGDTFIDWVTMAKSPYGELRESSRDWACDNLDIVEYIWDKGLFNPYMERTDMLRSIMYVAAKCNNTKILQKLIAKKVDVNLQSKYKETALHAACYFKNVAAFNMLLDAGADIEIRASYGIPLEYALESIVGFRSRPVSYSKENQWTITKELLKDGIKGYEVFPHYKVGAALFKSKAPLSMLQFCYDKGVEFDKTRINGGVTPIMRAAQYQDLTAFKFLAKKYQRAIKGFDDAGWSCFDYALNLPDMTRRRLTVTKNGKKYGAMVTESASEDNLEEMMDMNTPFLKYLTSLGVRRGSNRVKFYPKP